MDSADNYTTQYTCNGLDLVTHINYNGGKQGAYVYNAVGDLVEDWTGVNTYKYSEQPDLRYREQRPDHQLPVRRDAACGTDGLPPRPGSMITTNADGKKVSFSWVGA